MIGLPRLWVRQLGYLCVFFVLAVVLLIVANSQQIIKIQDYIPSSLTPTFFQPAADHYIIDIVIRNCYGYKSKLPGCGKPVDSEGELGYLGMYGEWTKVDKDLSLGSGWVKQQYLSYKMLKADVSDTELNKVAGKDATSTINRRVILDLTVANPSKDAKIKGNERSKYPAKIIKEYNSNKVAGESDIEFLKEQGKKEHGAVTEALTVDKDKAASRKISELNAKLHKESQRKQQGDKPTKEFEEDISPQDPEAGSKEVHAEANPEDELKAAEAKAEKKLEKEEIEKEEKEQKKQSEEAQKAQKEQFEQEQTQKEKQEQNEKRVLNKPLDKRVVEESRHGLNSVVYIPSKEDVKNSGWVEKSNGIWVKYGAPRHNAVTAIDILFGEDAVEPRPNWELVDSPLTGTATQSDLSAYLTYRKGPKADYRIKEYQPVLKVNKNGKFKILQVADLHFSTGYGKCRDPSPSSTTKGCQADPRTLKFLGRVLDIEKPDFVILTGDQIFGDAAPDAETAVFKALYPFIKRKIPYAVTMGNHDDEGSLSRNEIMSLSANLPFSKAELGPEDIQGVGNYYLTVEGPASHNPALSLYFLDTHKYSSNPKITPGYDWIKENQLKWLEATAASLKKSIAAYTHIHLSMAFFHIPLPEYRNLKQPFIGENREGVTAPRYNSNARSVLSDIGVKVVSVGHDHCNDYCLQDFQKKDGVTESKMWLCYGGGSGEGGYGGYGGYIRRLRVFDIDTQNGEIKTWKRAENDPDKEIDRQTIVQGGEVVNFA
ncbi:hypothetical protein G9P44_003254 [Scheffersomyces stipitis]|nr:hypothetical protein G9P44_003254 [Scheffersomyces stipitis]